MEQEKDIVALLRLHDADDTPDQAIMNQAADEIERLRDVLNHLWTMGIRAEDVSMVQTALGQEWVTHPKLKQEKAENSQ
jgi:hypothetical protein